MKWALENYIELSHGIDPDPETSEKVLSIAISSRAPYEGACMVAGEISARVRMCGEDSYVVEDCYGMVSGVPKKPGQIHRDRRMTFEDVVDKLKKVMAYCVNDEEGNRRSESYDDFKRRKGYRRVEK